MTVRSSTANTVWRRSVEVNGNVDPETTSQLN
jgi:hypothetical protein